MCFVSPGASARFRPVSLPVQPLQPEHVAAAAEMLANAFEVDAAYRYLFSDPALRQKGLTDFFAGNVRTHLPHRCTHVALSPTGDPLGTVTLRPPGGINLSALVMLRGLVPFGMRQGTGAVKRLMWLKHQYDAFNAELAGGKDHWYVHMMAVAPHTQGKGVGRQLLDGVLAATVVATPGVPAVLTTHLERNLEFYARAGFSTEFERRVDPPGGSPYTVWGMRRLTFERETSP